MSLRRSQSESRMPETGTSGLMSGDGKRGGANVSTRAHPRLYLVHMVFMSLCEPQAHGDRSEICPIATCESVRTPHSSLDR